MSQKRHGSLLLIEKIGHPFWLVLLQMYACYILVWLLAILGVAKYGGVLKFQAC
jgi:hypothetical protein